MRNYRELQVWNKAHTLTLNLYQLSRTFPKEETYGLTSQLRRAAASIEANLAEGCGRRTSGELARFVRIAMGSASELDYHLVLCHDLGFLRREEFHRASRELTEVRKMLTSFLGRIEAQTQGKASAAGA